MKRFTMRAGDGFRNLSGGGGGWGDPLDRPIESVIEDVLDGYVSAQQAEQVYGVRVEADGTTRPVGRAPGRPGRPEDSGTP